MVYFIVLLVGVISPTLWIAYFAKQIKESVYKAKIIRILNVFWFLFSIGTFVILYLLDETPICFALLLSGIALSRCFEIFYAFFRDSYDKLITNATKESKVTKEVTESTIFPAIEFLIYTKKSICSNEPLTYPERLVLAFRSYIELIFNFAILYLILPSGSFSRETLSSIDILYYSGLTITTVGYGDITPIHWFPKFLSVFEAICGIIIIVVCFTVYVSLALREEKT